MTGYESAHPWRAGELTGVIVLNAVGLVMIIAAYLVCRATAEPARVQLATSVGAGGLVVALAGNVVWFFSNLREVTGLRRQVLLGRVPVKPARPASRPRPAPDRGTSAVLVSSPSMSLYHRPDCILVIGKAVKPGTPAAHRRARRRPCQVCRPEPEALL